jgi:hypothetical protein
MLRVVPFAPSSEAESCAPLAPGVNDNAAGYVKAQIVTASERAAKPNGVVREPGSCRTGRFVS